MLTGGRLAFRCESPELLERGVDSTLRLHPARGGTAVTPTSASVTVYDAAGTVIVSAQAATCADGQAAYTVPAATTASLALGDRWTVVWSVLMPGETVARTVRTPAALCRSLPHPVVSNQDLYRRVRALDPDGPAPMTSLQDFGPYLEDAWQTVQSKLLEVDRWPWRILAPHQLREPHLLLTLARIWADEATRNNELQDQADSYRQQFELAWGGLEVLYDETESGQVGQGTSVPVRPSLWLGGRMP